MLRKLFISGFAVSYMFCTFSRAVFADGAAISGNVSLEDGAGLEGVRVVVSSGPGEYHDYTDSSGDYRITDIMDEWKNAYLSASKDGYTFNPASYSGINTVGYPTITGMDFTARGEDDGGGDSATISGHVRLKEGGGLEGVRVVVSSGPGEYDDYTDSSGDYRITDIVDEWTDGCLSATKAGYVFDPPSYSGINTVGYPSITGMDFVAAEEGGGEDDDGGQTRTISFAGREWEVKKGYGGPGNNNWSDSDSSVWVENGKLHMKIRRENSAWYCAEIYSVNYTGFGIHRIHVEPMPGELDQNAVFAFFIYKDDEHEVDIEFSRWGNSDPGFNAQYVIQPGPYFEGDNLHRFSMGLGGTHFSDWQSGSVHFKSVNGNYEEEKYLYGGNIPQSADNCRAHISLWLVDGDAPSDGQETEVIINDVGLGETGDSEPEDGGGDGDGHGDGEKSSDRGDGGACFIATACYDSGMAPEVVALKEFRDKYLVTNPVGEFFVKAYYALSPRCAEFIARHRWLKTIVRLWLKPVVKIARVITEK